MYVLSSNVTADTGYTYQCLFLSTNKLLSMNMKYRVITIHPGKRHYCISYIMSVYYGWSCRSWDSRPTDVGKDQMFNLCTTLKMNNAHTISYDGKILAS